MMVGDFHVNWDFEKHVFLSFVSSETNRLDAEKGMFPSSELFLKCMARLLVSPSMSFLFGEKAFVVVDIPI